MNFNMAQAFSCSGAFLLRAMASRASRVSLASAAAPLPGLIGWGRSLDFESIKVVAESHKVSERILAVLRKAAGFRQTLDRAVDRCGKHR
jgi:hypothetical protein